jgi:hypothetical protein
MSGLFAVARLPADEAEGARLPAAGGLAALVRRGDEVCLVCAEPDVPAGVPVERGFRALEVEGQLDFGATAVLASLATPLAAAGIPLLALSTFDTDVILVRETMLERATDVLEGAGHEVSA